MKVFFKKLSIFLLALLILLSSALMTGCSDDNRDKYQKEENGEEDSDTGPLTGYDATKNLLDYGRTLWIPFMDGVEVGQWELDYTNENLETRYERALKNAGTSVILDDSIVYYLVDSSEDMSIFIIELNTEDKAKLIKDNAQLLFGNSANVVTARQKSGVVVAIAHKSGQNVDDVLNAAMKSPVREENEMTLEQIIENSFKRDCQLRAPWVTHTISRESLNEACRSIESKILTYCINNGKGSSPLGNKLEFYGNLREGILKSDQTVYVFKFKDEASAIWANENMETVINGINSPQRCKHISSKRSGTILVVAEADTLSDSISALNMAWNDTYSSY